MADNTKSFLNTVDKGLVQDFSKSNQPEGSYSFALNAMKQTKDGDVGFISNEKGNSKVLDLIVTLTKTSNPDLVYNFVPIGHISLSGDEFIVFGYDYTSQKGAILKVDGNYTVTTLIVSSNLGFDPNHPIQGEWRLLNGCETVIYFNDFNSKDRAINIDRLETYTTGNVNKDLANYDDLWEIDNLDLVPSFKRGTIKVDNVYDSGGNIKIGSYQFFYRYKDYSGNTTIYSDPTLPIAINLGNDSEDFPNIALKHILLTTKGGLPSVIPNTTKRVELSLSDLDTSYESIEVGVAYYSGENGETVTYYNLEEIPITSSSLIYSFRGVLETSYQIDSADFNVDFLPKKISKTISTHSNRLFRANLKEEYRDWSVFQQGANVIKPGYYTKKVLHKSNEEGINTEKYYQDTRSYMRDEIYSFGIVWYFKDGTVSPVFHIPGREANTPCFISNFPSSDDNNHSRPNNSAGVTDQTWDNANYSISDVNLDKDLEVADEDIIDSNDRVKRWQVYNTAYRTKAADLSDTYYTEGEMAYWESKDYSYPDALDSNGNRVYPTGKIRHHKMPDSTLEEHFVTAAEPGGLNSYIFPLGVKFDNIVAPLDYADDILGYKIVRERRTEENKTVLDKGIGYRNVNLSYGDYEYTMQGFPFNNTYAAFGTAVNYLPYGIQFEGGNLSYSPDNGVITMQNDRFSILSPVTKSTEKYLATDHIKLERVFTDEATNSVSVIWGGTYVLPYIKAPSVFYQVSYVPLDYNNQRKVQDYVYSQAMVNKTTTIKSGDFLNNSMQSAYNVFTESTFDDITPAVTGKWGQDVTGDVNNPSAIEQSNAFYFSIKSNNRSIYGSLNDDTPYYNTHSDIKTDYGTEVRIFGGDSFISYFTVVKSYAGKDYTSVTSHLAKAVIGFFVESEINVSQRYSVSGDKFFEERLAASDDTTHLQDVVQSYLFSDELNDLKLSTVPSSSDATTLIINYANNTGKDHKLYINEDLNVENKLKPRYALSGNYNYTSTCINNDPLKIAYSERGNLEENSDSNRLFKALNYNFLPENTGDITKLINYNDRIYCLTENSLWEIIVNPQMIKTDSDNAYIGTGDLFSIPPKEIINTEVGYSGTKDPLSVTITPYGFSFVSEDKGKVFLFNGNQLQSLGIRGLNIFLEENLAIDIRKTSNFPFNTTTGRNGAGIITTYDDRYNRLVITKKDYEPIAETTVWNATNKAWYYIQDVGGVPTSVKFGGDVHSDYSLFRNKSWTLTYDLSDDTWISYHSYLPHYMFHTTSNFISNNNTTGLWEHDKGDYQSFYGTVEPHVIELVQKRDELNSYTSDVFHYISNVYSKDNTNNFDKELRYTTFDKAYLYNNLQTTGDMNIVVKNNSDPYYSLTYGSDILPVDRNEKTWSFSNIRDMTNDTDESIFTSNWSLTDYQNQYYIDKIINTNKINSAKSFYERSRFWDKWIALRLFYNTPNNTKIITKYLVNKANVSTR